MYDSVGIEVLAHAIIAESTASPPVPSFVTQKGFSAISRPSIGVILLSLDPGLIGVSGEVQPNGPDIRSSITLRGGSTGTTTITITSIAYVTPSTGTTGDGGDTQVQLTFQTNGTTLADPTAAVCGGIEVIVSKGV